MKNILQSLNPVRKSKDNPSVERKTSGELISSLSNGIKIIALGLVLALGISYAFAWTAPTATPPGGNVSAPVNVGNISQTKTGFLWSDGFGSTSGGYFAGNVGIGTVSPTEKLNVVGNIKASGTVCDSVGCIGSGGGGSTHTPITNEYWVGPHPGPEFRCPVGYYVRATAWVSNAQGSHPQGVLCAKF